MKEAPDSLSNALQDWRVRPPPDPNFRPTVWRRIREGSRESWAGYLRAHRLGWLVATALLIGLAGWTGHTRAQSNLRVARDAMAVNYLAEIDPRVQAKLRP